MPRLCPYCRTKFAGTELFCSKECRAKAILAAATAPRKRKPRPRVDWKRYAERMERLADSYYIEMKRLERVIEELRCSPPT